MKRFSANHAAVPQKDRCVCPVCFSFYPASIARSEFPACPDCGSEALDVEVVPLERYLADTPLDHLVEMRDKWSAATGFRETYKQEKLQRVSQVIDLKREFDASHDAA